MTRIFLFTALLLSGCTDRQQNQLLLQKMDSLQNNLDSLKGQIKELNEKGNGNIPDVSANADSNIYLTTLNNRNQKHQTFQDTIKHKVKQPAPIKKEKSTPITPEITGKKFYYKGLPQKISVEITAWDNGRRTLKFYNPSGEVTYTIEDVRMSYSSITDLKKFYDNGACALIETGMNPGASMYWYEINITFDENNNPLWKEEIEKPEMSLKQNMNNKSWWNAKTKSWVKQEIVKEQEAPH
ncbi:MAG: hypothetical protein JSS90_10310 [Bacteroidetes bacterium]|jgi:outer membrane murein-binding lipoprotein Lpp|nr:hypothetical protein [Bacteroidota bacterium]